jgi:hypothetical protein
VVEPVDELLPHFGENFFFGAFHGRFGACVSVTEGEEMSS